MAHFFILNLNQARRSKNFTLKNFVLSLELKNTKLLNCYFSSVIHKERSLLSNRIPVKPLTEDEYSTHLFRIPPPEPNQDEDDGAVSKMLWI